MKLPNSRLSELGLTKLKKITSENTQKSISGNLTDMKLCAILKSLDDIRQDIVTIQNDLSNMKKDMHGNASAITNLKKDMISMNICSEFLEINVNKI